MKSPLQKKKKVVYLNIKLKLEVVFGKHPGMFLQTHTRTCAHTHTHTHTHGIQSMNVQRNVLGPKTKD